LQPGGGQYVYKFSSSQIPDNNYSDEGLTPAVIGQPDNINYSIGKNGWCVLDMQYMIADGPGPDFIVHEGDTSPEGFICYVGETIDGPWISVGTGTGSSQFDIGISGLIEAQFIKIEDDGDGTAIAPDAGFDLDAIMATDIVPVELVFFSAEVVNDEVVLKWQTATETNNQGFEILRLAQSDSNLWERIEFMDGQGTTTETTDYIFNDKISEPGVYSYRLKQIDFDGSFEYSDIIEVEALGTFSFELLQNYPNPFNPATTIKYQIPELNFVTLKIYDVLGSEVVTLVNEEKLVGSYELEFNATDLPSGVYLYKLQAGSFVETKKMILLK
jgi:hypothetical protein